MVEAAFVFGITSIALFILLVKQSYLFYYACLIWDNRIFTVPSAVIETTNGEQKRYMEEIVVSTFGIHFVNSHQLRK